MIAPGPTVADSNTPAYVREIVGRYAIDLPAAAKAVLAEGRETHKPGQIAEDVRMIAAPHMALAAAAEAARREDLVPLMLGDALEGESRELGTVMAGIARSVRMHGRPIGAPAVILPGGETKVTIGKGLAGRGGRNTEFLLGFAVAMAGEAGVWAIAPDSDGTEDAAGAVVSPDTLDRGRAAGLSARATLSGHDSHSYFSAIGDLVVTGPTLTNVNDVRAVLVAPRR